jgi:hypothetical protein
MVQNLLWHVQIRSDLENFSIFSDDIGDFTVISIHNLFEKRLLD